MGTTELADRDRGAETYRTLIKQAGGTVEQFTADVRTGGLEAAVRRWVGKAEARRQVRRDPRVQLLEAQRRPPA